MLHITPAIQIVISHDEPLVSAFTQWLAENNGRLHSIGGGSSGGNFLGMFNAEYAPEIEAFLKQVQKRLRQEKRTATGQ